MLYGIYQTLWESSYIFLFKTDVFQMFPDVIVEKYIHFSDSIIQKKSTFQGPLYSNVMVCDPNFQF